jgi:hypothetical protein
VFSLLPHIVVRVQWPNETKISYRRSVAWLLRGGLCGRSRSHDTRSRLAASQG